MERVPQLTPITSTKHDDFVDPLIDACMNLAPAWWLAAQVPLDELFVDV